jgi:hypothetical protein
MSFVMGPFRFSHWFSIIGTVYLAIATPLFAYFRRSHPSKGKALLRLHVFGNLLAFAIISVHFAGQMGRPLDRFPDLGTGLALYFAMVLQVATGFLQRFRIVKINPSINRLVHVILVAPFYIIIGIHMLHGFGLI